MAKIAGWSKAAPSPSGKEVTGSSQRLYHLDALRCFCMLFGLLVHGATIGKSPLFGAISTVSDHFRMATFFLVSGFFTALVANRGTVAAFVANRGRLILLPLAAGVLLLNPVTTWLIQLYHGGGEGFVDYFSGGWRLPLPGPIVWHLHLWFLISLFVYAMLTPLLLWVAESRATGRVVDGLEALPGLPRLMLMAAAVGLLVVLLRGANDRLAGPGTALDGGFIVQATCNYFAYFAAGLFAFRHRSLFDAMHRFCWPGLLLFGAAYLLHPLIADALPRSVERASYWVARAGFIFLIVCALMWVARRLVTNGSPLLSRLTDGVYTFYIFHFLVIYIIANLLKPFTEHLMLTYVLVVAIGYPLLFLIHERLIAPSPLLMLLFNGKAAKKRALPA